MSVAMRALLVAVALCVFQTSQANLLPSFDDVTSAVKKLEESTMASLKGAYDKLTSGVSSEEAKLIANTSSAVSKARAEVGEIINGAETKGISVVDCSSTATAKLADITIKLPVSLGHCAVDYLDAFNYYGKNVENDFALIYDAITDGVKQVTECFLEVTCYWDVFNNVTTLLEAKEKDIAFQVVNAGTAGVNLLGTITLCDEEKSTQAALDAANVVPATRDCVKQKEAAASVTTSS